MNILTIDYETTTHENGNFHSNKNKAVCLGYKINDNSTNIDWLEDVDKDFTIFWSFDLIVAFNAKFELGWSRRLGFDLPKAVWCVQLAEYMLDRQKPYPSLEETAKKYGLSSKLDIVKTQYWDKGVDTDAIPKETLTEYCTQDVNLTYAIYLIQVKLLQARPALYKLFKLACQDLLVLAEMEWNGLPFNESLCKERADECLQEKRKIILELEKGLYG